MNEHGFHRRIVAIGGLLIAVALVVVLLNTRGRGKASPSEDPPSHEIPRIEGLSALDPRLAKAVRKATSEIERDRDEGDAFGRLGRVYHTHKYFGLARRCYETARRLAPAKADWPYYLGSLATGRGQTEVATDSFHQALRLEPDYLPTYLRLGNVLLADGRLEEAEEMYRELVVRSPEGPWGYLGHAKVARRRGRLQEAADLLQESLSRAPEDREGAYLLAMTYRDLGRLSAALPHLEGIEGKTRSWPADPLMDVIRGGRQDLQGLIQTANRLLDEGQANAAANLYRAVLADDAGHFDALYNLGVIYGRQGRFAEAKQSLEEALRGRPGDADAHFALAMAYASLRQFRNADNEMATVLRLDPEHEGARQALRGGPSPP